MEEKNYQDLPRYASFAYEQQIHQLQDECDRLDLKISRRNKIITGISIVVVLCAVLAFWMNRTQVLTVDFSKENLSVQLSQAKSELDDTKAKLEKLESKKKDKVVASAKEVKSKTSNRSSGENLTWLFLGGAILFFVVFCLCAKICNESGCRSVDFCRHAKIGIPSLLLAASFITLLFLD